MNELYLKNNRITTKSSYNLLSNLSLDLITLDLSENNIGTNGFIEIGNFLRNSENRL